MRWNEGNSDQNAIRVYIIHLYISSGRHYSVFSAVLRRRADCCCGHRLRGATGRPCAPVRYESSVHFRQLKRSFNCDVRQGMTSHGCASIGYLRAKRHGQQKIATFTGFHSVMYDTSFLFNDKWFIASEIGNGQWLQHQHVLSGKYDRPSLAVSKAILNWACADRLPQCVIQITSVID